MFVLPGKLSRKIFGMLVVFFLVALTAIGMTLYLSWQLEGVAAAINDAGSQRMRGYRMAHLMAEVLDERRASLPDADAAIQALGALGPADAVLVKGSRVAGLEKVAEALLAG